MAFNNNNDNMIKNITTKVFQAYSHNKNEDEHTTLSINMWKNRISIAIAPMLPENMQVDNKMFDYKNSISVLLNMMQVKTLLTGINYLKKNDDKINNISIATDENTFLKISNGKEYESNYYILAIGNKTDILYYGFNIDGEDQTIYIDYNEETAQADSKKVFKNLEFECFVDSLKSAYDGIKYTASHAAIDSIYRSKNTVMNSIQIVKNLIEAMLGGMSHSSQDNVQSNSYRNNNSSSRGFSRRRQGMSVGSGSDDNSSSSNNNSFSSRRKKIQEQSLDDEYNAAVDEENITNDQLNEFLLDEDDE